MCGKLVSNRRPSEWKSNAFIVVPLGDMYSQVPNKRGGWENGKNQNPITTNKHRWWLVFIFT